MEESYENIENYLHGKLPEKERLAFTERLKQEPELETEVNAFRLSEDVIEEGIAGQLRTDFAAWDKETVQKKSGKIVNLRSFRRMIAVAASLLFLSVFAFLQWRTTQQTYNSTALAAYYHSDDLGTTRSGASNTNELNAAMEAIQAENYPLAIQALLAINDTSAYYPDAQFLLADAYYKNEELGQASTILERVLTSNESLLKEKAEWLKVLIALKAGKKSDPEFQFLLTQISNNSAHSFQPKATELEATLDGFWVKLVD